MEGEMAIAREAILSKREREKEREALGFCF